MAFKKMKIRNKDDASFPVRETVSQLRVSLGLSKKNLKSIVVTSSVPDEGKSYVARNLWTSFAQSGASVLLIDADMRNSVLSQEMKPVFGEEPVSLAHVLSGQRSLKEAIYETDISNAFLLPMSGCLSNPALLLENGSFEKIMDSCKEAFDFIIVDSPPVSLVSDALVMAEAADGSVLVVRAGKTSRRLVQNSCHLLQRTQTPLLGMVMNRILSDTKQVYYGGYQ